MRNTLVDLYLASDRPRDALELMQDNVVPRPSATMSWHLARIHQALGDRAAAIRYYTIFLEDWRGADEGLRQKREAEAALDRLTREV